MCELGFESCLHFKEFSAEQTPRFGSLGSWTSNSMLRLAASQYNVSNLITNLVLSALLAEFLPWNDKSSGVIDDGLLVEAQCMIASSCR